MNDTHRHAARPHLVIWCGYGRDRRDLREVCFSFRVNGSLTEPGPTAVLQLAPVQGNMTQTKGDLRQLSDLYRDVRPNSVVSVGFEEPGGLGLFLVDRVSRKRVLSGNQVVHVVELTCSGLTRKLLTQDNVIHSGQATETSPFLDKIEAVTGPDHPLLVVLNAVWAPEIMPDTNKFIGATVEEAIDWLLGTATSMRMPMLQGFQGSKAEPKDIIETDITTWNDALGDPFLIYSEAPQDYQGNLWGFIQSILDTDFYEVFTDSIPNGTEVPRQVLVVRPKPFDETGLKFASCSDDPGIDWEKLRTRIDRKRYHEIPDHAVYSEDIGVSDNDSFAYYMILADHELGGNAEAYQEGLAYPLVDTYGLIEYGLRSYQARISLVAGDVTAKAEGNLDTGQVAVEVRNARNRLFNWYRLNHEFESGTVTVVGSDRYRWGDKVYFPDIWPHLGDQKGVYFYCTTCQWAWQFGGSYTTIMQLTRGHNDSTIDLATAIITAGAPAANPLHFAES